MEERKEYSIVGTVTIGTDEYRDLIESRMEMEKSRDYYMREGWKKDEQIKNLTTENAKLNEELTKCKAYIKKITSTSTSSDDDVISVFMKVFGEE